MAATEPPAVLGVDVGGSGVRAGVVTDTRVIGDIVDVTWDHPEGSVELLVEAVARARRRTTDWARVRQVSIGVPGPFDHATGTSHMAHKLRALYGVSLTPLVEAAVDRSVVWLNDADAFGLGVAHSTVREHRRVLAITLGTGVGSAFVIDGRLATGPVGPAANGEVWNLPFRDGLLEDHVSAAALLRKGGGTARAATAGGAQGAGSVAQLSAIARAGGRRAQSSFADYGAALGEGIAPVVAAFQPTVVVLGGGIARAADLIVPSLTRSLGSATGRACPEVAVTTRADVALLGAAVAAEQGTPSG